MGISGLLNINKPYGKTSFSIIQELRKRFGCRKVGHAGTLDPLATGILLVCFGKATRFMPFLVECKKGYRAILRLGIETLTQDREGRVISVYTGRKYPTIDEIGAVINTLTGEIEQIPPMYSALKYQGRRLYELAREGKDVPRESRRVFIYNIVCTAYSYPFLIIDVSCSKGTYIRTLASDIGKLLGTGAHLWGLERTSSGDYDVSDAIPWEQVRGLNRDEFKACLIPNDRILSFLPVVIIDANQREAMLHGRQIPLLNKNHKTSFNEREILRVFDEEGLFLGLGNLLPLKDNSSDMDFMLQPSLVLYGRQ